MIKRMNLRHSSNKSSLVSLQWEGNGEKEDGRKQPTAAWVGGVGGGKHWLGCSTELLQSFWLIDLSPIYFLISVFFKILQLILVTYPVSQNIGDSGCAQPGSSSWDTSSTPAWFLLIFPEVHSRKILWENFVLWWFILYNSGHHSNKKWQRSVEKKKNNWKIDSYLCFSKPPEQFTISGKRCNQAPFPLMSECRIMLRWIFQRRHFIFMLSNGEADYQLFLSLTLNIYIQKC